MPSGDAPVVLQANLTGQEPSYLISDGSVLQADLHHRPQLRPTKSRGAASGLAVATARRSLFDAGLVPRTTSLRAGFTAPVETHVGTFANPTGPRGTGSDTVVASALPPERAITLASAVGPSSHGL